MPRGIQFTNTTPVDAAQNTDITLTQANLSFYNKNKLKQLFQETQKEYKYIVNSFTHWAKENTIPSSISPVTLDSYSEYKLNEGIKPVSMTIILRHSSRLYNECGKETACYFLNHLYTVNQKLIMKELDFLKNTFMI